MTCKHKNTESRWHMDTVRSVLVERWRCVDCEELVGMGVASEPWIEVKAVELVWSEWTILGSYRHGWDGVRYAATDMAMWHAGHLARCIADHDELQGAGDP